MLGERVEEGNQMIKGRVVLIKKNLLDLNDLGASALDRIHELFGNNISLQLISVVRPEDESSEGRLRGKLGKAAIVEDWITTITPLIVEESTYAVTFEWNEEIGIPGAFLVKNDHHSEFYLKTLTLEDVPGHGQLHFDCNSWVYPSKRYTKDRIFFANKAYLPGETPELLRQYREEELVILRGTGSGMLQEWDRVYDYAFYNDLGNPDDDIEYARPVLGGSSEYPYPRRGRTGRPPTKSDPKTESRLPLLQSLSVYVPKDEQFGHLKLSGFLGYGLKSIGQFLVSEGEALTDTTTHDEFDTFQDVLKTYEGGLKLPQGKLLDQIQENIPFEILKALSQSDGEGLAKFPMPQVIKEDKSAWRTDEEFAREMLAGVNPVSIRLLKEFPPTSKLDFEIYGNQNSSIKPSHIEQNLDGLEIEEAIKSSRLFILDHHDSLMPYVRRINATPTKIYATRTLLFLQKDGTLKPLAIELSLPHPEGDQLGAISKVYTPAEHGVEESVWQLAKAYVAVNDSGVHQLISHWLNTHAVIEPFVIATNRQLSVLHPIHKLLQPHFRDTMNINAFARQILIDGGGFLEQTVFPGRYAMEMSSFIYKDWVLTDQALPVDLVKRGMAIEDSNSTNGIRLTVEDYPYAVDGLEIWSAIKTWVEDYCSFYYKNDNMVQNDTELQSWWKELREEGHGDKKDEPWWPKMDSCHNLMDMCTTIIWVASALHASVNFGQYAYAGYLPNRPTLSRRLMPEPNTPEYEELKENPDNVFLKTITAQLQALIGVSLIELLSRHPSDEVYLGQRESSEWTMDSEPLKAFEKFGKKIRDIEGRIVQRNGDHNLKNRMGPVKVPYTLLYPTSEKGLTGKGIPNSVSI
ncbi:probable linoleate 9S-lipoxygenase 5 [Cynara cardunculus var. scolymus]|uniref:probable linoleate 9S-lipoxygenase 5 n=1 Tax=Cynara cardunculus var. scolymus TaxID=59895 RepID=UPI000D62366E|nr:probable linoleate 9S-lipoxygenase 5 [Cynara cardunculus var. scolymus]